MDEVEVVVVVLQAGEVMAMAWIPMDMEAMDMRAMAMGHPWVMVDMDSRWGMEEEQVGEHLEQEAR